MVFFIRARTHIDFVLLGEICKRSLALSISTVLHEFILPIVKCFCDNTLNILTLMFSITRGDSVTSQCIATKILLYPPSDKIMGCRPHEPPGSSNSSNSIIVDFTGRLQTKSRETVKQTHFVTSISILQYASSLLLLRAGCSI